MSLFFVWMLLICFTSLISSTSFQHDEQMYTRKWFYQEYTSLYCNLLISKELLINTCYLYFGIHKACYHSFSQKGEIVYIPLTRTDLISISYVVFYCWCSRDRAFSCDIYNRLCLNTQDPVRISYDGLHRTLNHISLLTFNLSFG